MRIVDRKTFLALPPGTIYAKYEPCVVEETMMIKGDTLVGFKQEPIDWFYEDLGNPLDLEGHDEAGGPVGHEGLEAMREKGVSIPNVRCGGRDGCFNDDQMFLVWERGDVLRMQDQINETLATAYKETDNAETD